MKIAIVGAEAAKFTLSATKQAKALIRGILAPDVLADITLISGGCHLGGADIWAEEIADELGIPKLIFKPAKRTWDGGYKERNLRIARECDVLHNIVVDKLPPTYRGMRFVCCYHCVRKSNATGSHVKSGGCWTAWKAEAQGKPVFWHVISNQRDEHAVA